MTAADATSTQDARANANGNATASASANGDASTSAASATVATLRDIARERPWAAVAAGAAVGGVLGGLVFSRFARLAFVATTGFVVHELWHREGGFDLEGTLRSLARGDRAR